MLPPNLTRHYWEARRAYLGTMGQTSGFPMTPWFQLTPTERLVAEKEVELLRQAIRTAEEEQDLVAALNPRTAAPTDSAPAVGNPAEEQPSALKPAKVYPVAGEVRMYVSSDRQLPIRYEVLISPLPDRAPLDKKPPREDCECYGCASGTEFLKLTVNEGLFQQRTPGVNADEKVFGTGSGRSAAPAAAPKPMTFTEALAKWGWPEGDTDGDDTTEAFGTPVRIGFDSPSLSAETLRRSAQDRIAADIRRNLSRYNLGTVI